MKKLLILIPFFLFADVDPFAAGINSGYGLTQDEKAILQNRKQIQTLQQKLKKLSSKIQSLQNKNALKFVTYDEKISNLEEKLAAFNSIVDELASLKVSLIKYKQQDKNITKNIESLNADIDVLKNKLNSLQKRVAVLEDSMAEIVDTQNKNFNTLKKSIQEILDQLKQQSKKASLSPRDAFYMGKKAFFDGKLEKAKKMFLISLNGGFLRATSSYYLGEIAYKKHKYKEALAYYKKSISIYPKKTSFTERLLYHTGISFVKIGNKKAAILTFKKLIKDYPSSKYAKLAKKELEKLK